MKACQDCPHAKLSMRLSKEKAGIDYLRFYCGMGHYDVENPASTKDVPNNLAQTCPDYAGKPEDN